MRESRGPEKRHSSPRNDFLPYFCLLFISLFCTTNQRLPRDSKVASCEHFDFQTKYKFKLWIDNLIFGCANLKNEYFGVA